MVVSAAVADMPAFAAACKGRDAVISAYNPSWANPHIYEETLRNYLLILETLRQSDVRRWLCVEGAGTQEPGKRTGTFRQEGR